MVYIKNMADIQVSRRVILLLFCVVFSLGSACSLEPSLDKSKFVKCKGDALAVRESISQGASYRQISDKVHQFSGEIDALKNKVANKREERLLAAYSDLLDIYRDGLVLLRYQTDFPFLSTELKGKIYVGQDVEPIVQKYRFTTETHIYKPTGQQWKSISDEAIKIIWRNADDELGLINNITNY